MTDEECVETYGRMGEKQDAYFAEVEEKAGIPLAGIVESFERLGLKLTSCSEIPNAPIPRGKRGFISMVFLSPEGVGGDLFFDTPRHRASCRSKRGKRRGI
jgi:hypothetical protein